MRRRRAAPSLRARVLPGHAVEGDAALRRLPLARQLRPREPGAEAGDLGLPRLRHGHRPVAHDLVAAATPPSAQPHARRVPLLHPGPHCVSGAHASGLRAPGAQLRRLQKVLLPAGSVRPQVGAASAGAAVRALRANGISGSSHRPEAQH